MLFFRSLFFFIALVPGGAFAHPQTIVVDEHSDQQILSVTFRVTQSAAPIQTKMRTANLESANMERMRWRLAERNEPLMLDMLDEHSNYQRMLRNRLKTLRTRNASMKEIFILMNELSYTRKEMKSLMDVVDEDPEATDFEEADN